MSQEIAFLGLGLMGAPMAANLAHQGYSVIAWNRNSDRPGIEIAQQGGATIVSSIAEAVANAEIISRCKLSVDERGKLVRGKLTRTVNHYDLFWGLRTFV